MCTEYFFNVFVKVKKLLPFYLGLLILLFPVFVFAERDTNSLSTYAKYIETLPKAQETVTIQLMWYHQFQFAGYYAAIEKGFYAEEGLHVELRQRVAGTNYIDDVLQGRAQYGIADTGLLLSRMQGNPVVLLAQIIQYSPLVFLTREDSGIKSVEGLSGKRIMLDTEGHGNMPLLTLLLNTFGGLDSVKVQPHTLNPYDLINGNTDAYASYITHQPDWYKQQNVATNIINPRDYGIDFYGDNLFTTEQELAENPERVEKIRRATLKGWKYALENQEELVELILDKYNPKKLSREHLAYQAREYKKLIAPDFIEMGEFSTTRYQKTANSYVRAGFIEQRALDSGFFYQAKNQLMNYPDIAGLKVWVIVFVITAFFIMTALMFRVSRKINFELQSGMKRFRYGILALLLLFFIIVSTVARWVLEYNEQQILKSRQLQLETVLHATSDRLNIWIEQHKIYLQQLTQNPKLLSLTERLLTLSPKPESLLSSKALLDARRFFSDKKNTFGEKGFFIISPDRISLGSIRDTNLGTRNLIAEHKPQLLDRVFQGEVLFIPPIQSDILQKSAGNISTTTMFFAAPIRNNHGKVIAVLTQRLDPLADFSHIIHLAQIGETDETYAFSQQGRLLSESRFNRELRRIGLIAEKQNSSLSIEIRDPGGDLQRGYQPQIERFEQALTRMAASAVNGESGVDMSGYRDYKGRRVQGAWLWDHSLSMGLATEISLDEAMSPYYRIRGSVLGVLTLTLFLSTGALLFILFTGERVSHNLYLINKKLKLEIKERVSTETKLKDREARFRAIFHTVVDGIITINTQGLIESFNPAAESIFGYKTEEVIGKNISMLMFGKHQIRHDDYLKRYLQTGNAKVIGLGRELEARRRNGSTFPLELSVSEMWVGNERKFTGVVRDISKRKQADGELKKNEESLNLAQAITHLGSWEWNIVTGEIWWSDEQYRIFGLEPGEITPSYEYYLNAINKEDQGDVLTSFDKAFSNKANYNAKFRLIRKNGEERIVHAQGIIERDLNREPVRMLGTTHDITERKRAEIALGETETQFRLILDNVPAMIAYLDTKLHYQLVNQHYAEFFGFEIKDCIDQHLIPIVGENAYAFAKPYIDEVLTGQNVNFETCPQDKQGHSQWLSVSYVPDKNDNGDVIGFYSLIINIHQRKLAEKELYQYKEQLEELVKQRTRALLESNDLLAKAKQQAELASRSKSIFLANMSHELRTPLNAVLGYANVLLNDRSLQDVQREKVSIIKRSGENLLFHISDILDLVKIEANKVELSPTHLNIATFIDNLCNYFKTHAEQKGIDLIGEVKKGIPLVVDVDERRLQQILLNLVGNAVKFTTHGKVIVQVGVCKSAYTKVGNYCCLRFSVQDTGVGIPKESLEQVFEPFVQLNGTNHDIDGTGLGLNIVQQLVRLMGSEIKLQSEVGVGSHFWFDLMLPVSEAKGTNTFKLRQTPQSYQGKKRTILVVDDVEDNRKVLHDLLEGICFNVLLAKNGEEALVLLKDSRPDLIFMDLFMPVMDGYQLLSKLKEFDDYRQTPVLAISANVTEKERALKAGFDAFLAKPTAQEQIVEVLGKFLGLKWSYKESSELPTKEEKLTPPCSSDLEKLHNLIKLGKMKRIREWADDLLIKSPENSAFSQHVKTLAKEIDDEKLQALIRKYQT